MTTAPVRGPRGRTHVVTTALSSRSADRDLRERRYLVSQAVRLVCFLTAALLPLPVPVRLALLALSIVLPWGAVVAANAGPARVRRRVGDILPAARGRSAQRQEPREGRMYRLRWRLSYGLLQAYGPAQLSGDSDPRRRMLAERASGDHRSLPTGTGPTALTARTASAPARPAGPARGTSGTVAQRRAR